MKQLIRGVAAFLTALAAFYFVEWVGGALLASIGIPFWVASLTGILVAFVAGRFVWRRSASIPAGFAGSVATGALIVGAIGFVGGFFGPIVFAPEANQGPLLGIFITGPLGFVLGAVGGGVNWFMQRKKGAVATADRD
jgi:hypothetical protein